MKKVEYRVTKVDPKVPLISLLKKIGSEGWIWCGRDGDNYIWHKTISVTYTKKEPVYNKEWEEFRKKYKTINNKGLSVKALVVKHNKLVEEGLHKKIMENLDEYCTFIEVGKKKEYACMASTYLGGRYNDSWDIIKDMSKKWMQDEFKLRGLEPHIIDNVMLEVQAWEAKNVNQEVNSGKLDNIIYYVENGKHRE